jgi:hypothetical protein
MRDALVKAGFPPRRRRRQQILVPEVSRELDAPTRETLEAGLTETVIEEVVRIATNAIECFRDRSEPDLSVRQAQARLSERLMVSGAYLPERPTWLPRPDQGRRRKLVNLGFVVVGEEFALPLRESVEPSQADGASLGPVPPLTMVTCLYAGPLGRRDDGAEATRAGR